MFGSSISFYYFVLADTIGVCSTMEKLHKERDHCIEQNASQTEDSIDNQKIFVMECIH